MSIRQTFPDVVCMPGGNLRLVTEIARYWVYSNTNTGTRCGQRYDAPKYIFADAEVLRLMRLDGLVIWDRKRSRPLVGTLWRNTHAYVSAGSGWRTPDGRSVATRSEMRIVMSQPRRLPAIGRSDSQTLVGLTKNPNNAATEESSMEKRQISLVSIGDPMSELNIQRRLRFLRNSRGRGVVFIPQSWADEDPAFARGVEELDWLRIEKPRER
jgi:hypothetical protein